MWIRNLIRISDAVPFLNLALELTAFSSFMPITTKLGLKSITFPFSQTNLYWRSTCVTSPVALQTSSPLCFAICYKCSNIFKMFLDHSWWNPWIHSWCWLVAWQDKFPKISWVASVVCVRVRAYLHIWCSHLCSTGALGLLACFCFFTCFLVGTPAKWYTSTTSIL